MATFLKCNIARLNIARLSIAALSFVAVLPAALAQNPADRAPSKVLVIQREYLKPGRAGSLHEKSESAFVKASAAAKLPVHYLAMDSLSGPYRSLFMLGYDSFDAWQKDADAQEKIPGLSASFDRASLADGDLLASSDQTVWVLREDLSYGTGVDLTSMRYFEITAFQTKPGREQEFNDLVKIYKDSYPKAAPQAQWATYENQYGTGQGGVFLVIIPVKSLSEIDQSFVDGKKFMAALGDSGLKRLGELEAASVASVQTNLFHFNPRMSYVSERFTSVDPAFWKPKASAAPRPAAASTPRPQ